MRSVKDTSATTLHGSLGHWRATVLVALGLLSAYLLLLTPDWTPGGDSELLTAAARSIVRGEGYVYNGRPLRLAPPGFPVVLAGLFTISPTFLAGKLLNIVCMVGGAAISHRVLIRLTPPTIAWMGALLSGLLVSAYPLTMWLHSDPLFLLLGWIAIWCAVRCVEARTIGAMLLAMIGLLLTMALLPLIRYAAAFHWGIPLAMLIACIAAWRRSDRRRVMLATGGAVLGTLITCGMIYATMSVLSDYETRHDIALAGPGSIGTLTDSEHELPDILNNGAHAERPFYVDRPLRLLRSGEWAAWLFWYPARFVSGLPGEPVFVSFVGFACLLLMSLAARQAFADRHRLAAWTWLSLIAYVLLIAFIWPLPNARYLVPVAPLMIAAVLQGCLALAGRWNRPRLARRLAAAFVFSLVSINGMLFGIDVYVQRFTKPYTVYEGGRLVSMLDALALLETQFDVGDGELAVSERYVNLGRERFIKTGTRELVLLMDRRVKTVPDWLAVEPGRVPEIGRFAQQTPPVSFETWAKNHGVKFYLVQRPDHPARLWHFRLPVWLHDLIDDSSDRPASEGWLLFTQDNGWEHPITLPASSPRVRRIPGL